MAGGQCLHLHVGPTRVPQARLLAQRRARPATKQCRHAAPRAAAAALPTLVDQERLEAQVAVVLGTQWGDEGKGKLVDILARQYDIVARAQVRAVSGSTRNLVQERV